MGQVDYDQRLYAVYAKGRAMSPAALAVWTDAFARHLPTRRPLSVLDLGCGIGRFTPALADAFGGPAYGVEPSDRMRAIAEADAGHPRVTYVKGTAEAIPLPDEACDAALLYFVWHHVVDRAAAARELARVVRPDGRLLIRTCFADRMPELWWYRHFPRAREVDRAMYETLVEVLDTLGAAGWRQVALEQVVFETTVDRAEDFSRLQLRALSTFEFLTEEETADGFAAIGASLAAGNEPAGPVLVPADLLVLAHKDV